MGKLPDIGYPQTGDNADVGQYACMQCQDKPDPVLIFHSGGKLPKCKKCKETYWFKL